MGDWRAMCTGVAKRERVMDHEAHNITEHGNGDERY